MSVTEEVPLSKVGGNKCYFVWQGVGKAGRHVMLGLASSPAWLEQTGVVLGAQPADEQSLAVGELPEGGNTGTRRHTKATISK